MLALVVLTPLLAVLMVNQNIESPGLFFGGLAAYLIIFVAVGWRFELWRAQRFFNKTFMAKFSLGRAFAYAWLDIILGTFIGMLTIGWVITLVRNILIYPVSEWGHPYPDLSWGGPTWQGAVALHTGSAILSIFLIPWVLSWLVGLHMQLITRLMVREKS